MQDGEHEDEAKDDEEGELKAGLKELPGFPEEDKKGGSEEGIEQITRPAQDPAQDDDGEHDGGANGGSGPASEGDVEPKQRQENKSAEGAREVEDTEQAEEDGKDDGHAEAIDGEDVVGGCLDEGFGDFVGESGFPAESEGPFEPERFVFHGQALSQGAASPGAEAVGEGRGGRGGKDLPISVIVGLEVVVDAELAEVIAVIEGTWGHGGFGRGDDAGDFDELAGEEIGEGAGGADGNAAGGGLPTRFGNEGGGRLR